MAGMFSSRVRSNVVGYLGAFVFAATVGVPASASAVDYPARPGTTGAIPDGGGTATPRDVLFDVSGLSGRVEDVSVSFTATHTWVGDLQATLLGPLDGSPIFNRPGVPASTFGRSTNLNGTYTFSDKAPEAPSFETATITDPVPPGTYRASDSGGANTLITPSFGGPSPNGVWTLRISDHASPDTGAVTDAVLHITGPPPPDPPPADPPPPDPPPPPTDTDPPETTITKGAPNTTDASKVKFKFRSDEPGSTFQCKFDKKAWKACSSPRTVKRLDEGTHKFKVRAVDAAGNVDPTAAKDRFKVED